MEHRYSRRWTAGVEARVYKRDRLVAQGQILDVSLHGLFLQLEDAELGLHQSLEVEVAGAPGTHLPVRRLKVLVARVSEEGVGLEFEELNGADRDLLKRLIVALRNQDQASSLPQKAAG